MVKWWFIHEFEVFVLFYSGSSDSCSLMIWIRFVSQIAMNYGFDLRGRCKLSESMDICGLIKFFVLVISYLFFLSGHFETLLLVHCCFLRVWINHQLMHRDFNFAPHDRFASEWFCESNTVIVDLQPLLCRRVVKTKAGWSKKRHFQTKLKWLFWNLKG